MELNQSRLEHEAIQSDVKEAIGPIKQEIQSEYISTISSLTKTEIADIIRHNFSSGVDENGNIVWKPWSEIKPGKDDYAYAVIVQAAMHLQYPNLNLKVDSWYGKNTRGSVLQFMKDQKVPHNKNDQGWAGPKVFEKIYELFSSLGKAGGEEVGKALDVKTVENLEIEYGKYSGQVINGIPEGKGVMTYANGDVYDGESKGGKREGKGVYTRLDGRVYDGEWKGGKREGKGVYTRLNGDVYNGEWKGGLKEGKGVYTRLDEAIYDGEWKGGKKEGKGVYTRLDGRVYDGEWKGGRREGKGVMTNIYGESHTGLRIGGVEQAGGEEVGKVLHVKTQEQKETEEIAKLEGQLDAFVLKVKIDGIDIKSSVGFEEVFLGDNKTTKIATFNIYLTGGTIFKYTVLDGDVRVINTSMNIEPILDSEGNVLSAIELNENVFAIRKGREALFRKKISKGDLTVKDESIKKEILAGNFVSLEGMTSLDKETAEVLINRQLWLYLDGIKNLNQETAETLAKHEGILLSLDGIKNLNQEIAEALAKYRGGLSLGGIKSLNQETAEALAKHRGTLYLEGITNLNQETAEALAKYEGGMLHLGPISNQKIIHILEQNPNISFYLE